MFLMFLSLSLFQFFVSIFYQHQTLLIIILFFFCLVVYSSIKHSIVASLSIPWAVCAFALPGGWYNGVSTLIQMIIGFIISLLFFLLFDYLFSKIKMRALVIYLSLIVQECFSKYISKNIVKDGFIEKKRHKDGPKFIRSVELTIEDLISTRKSRIEYKVSSIIKKADNMLRKDEYYFRFNRKYASMIYEVCFCYKKIFRDLAYITQLNEHYNLISSEIKNFDVMINSIRERLSNVHLSLKIRDKNLINNGINHFSKLNNLELFTKVKDLDAKRKLRLMVFGIVLLEDDLSALEKLLKYNSEFYN